MPGGLDAVTCGACGARLGQGGHSCPRCAAPLTGFRTGSGTLLTGTESASLGSRSAALAVDAAIVVTAFLTSWSATDLAGATGLGPVLGFTTALVTGALLLRSFRASGRTPGAVVGRLRYVDAFSGTAPGPGRWPGQQLDAVDLTVRDPLVPDDPLTPRPDAPERHPASPRPGQDAPPRPAQPPRPARSPRHDMRSTHHEAVPAHPASSAVLISGAARIHVSGTVLVGRDPEPNPGEQVDVLVPFGDFDPSISTTHAHLQWDGAICWVTDRSSTNGTSVTTHEGTWQVPPGASAPARPGDTVHLGSRPFTLVVSG
ncbi:FHA domain-containing protein [Myceligenerans indicum]|uniref:FHA domain-containing protein n=1 Tax=Myceligenerans indicum TaxID=2593663 RepID=A0ABS1LEZ8_9MICO|nr:FHA domain-containing protein [Myceligenerans indicum]MBL0884841.1 FHA domain-containing protein [Myceligenerans indicum]